MSDCRAACPIPDGGHCPRHAIHKIKPWVQLCINKPAYFDAWEQGRGPGQEVPPAQRMPSLRKRAWNLVRSLAAFVSDGLQLVDKTEYTRRLSICNVCEHRSGNWCAHCGCNLSIKAAGRAFHCPISLW